MFAKIVEVEVKVSIVLVVDGVCKVRRGKIYFVIVKFCVDKEEIIRKVVEKYLSFD